MSVRPEQIGPVPEDTARVAKAAFPRGNLLRSCGHRGDLFAGSSSLRATQGSLPRPEEDPPAGALATAASINVCRITDWLNDIPIAATRRSRLAALAPAS